MSKQTHLVVIDPQNSFCKVVASEQQQATHDGELCIPGAWEDMQRVADLIARLGTSLSNIHVTLDSHHLMHVAHPVWYRDSGGHQPAPFTIMRAENDTIVGGTYDASGKLNDIGSYECYHPTATARTLAYLRELERAGRYAHCVWPPHCLIGTPGHNIVQPLMNELLTWARAKKSTITFVSKGSNPYVEHLSAVRAEVIDPNDPGTQPNLAWVESLEQGDEILLAGEAGSHCLANTVRDLADALGSRGDEFLNKCVLLTDGTSPVLDFEAYQHDFIKQLSQRGMKLTTTLEYLQ